MRKKHLALVLGLIFSGLGAVIPFWPLVLLGLLSCAFAYPILAIIIGAFADVIFVIPTGFLHCLSFPFSILGTLAALLSLFASSRLRSRKMY